MTIKNKLRFGFSSLFVIFLILGGIAVWYINQLSRASTEILKDNYETLEYAQAMLQNLGDRDSPLEPQTARGFATALGLQEKNETEPGEKEATAVIRKRFDQINGGENSLSPGEDKDKIRSMIFRIIDMNMRAIVRKNDKAAGTAHNATIFVALMSSFCFLAAFSFIVNFPGYVANPLHELSEGIREIARRNYSRRIEIASNDEFGKLAGSFNVMAAKLNEYESSNLAQIQFEKLRIETIVRNLNDAVIGFDEKQTVLFANPTALHLLGLREEDIVGKNGVETARKNDLLRRLLAEGDPGELKIFANDKESFFTRDRYPISIGTENLHLPDEPVERSEKNIGSVILLKNITKFHELDEAKTHFIATISHELKTPISAIKMSLRLLQDSRVGTLNAEQGELVGNIRSDTDRLLKITRELLDLAQAETGNIQLNLLRTSAMEIVDYALKAVQTPAAEKAIRILVQAQPALSAVQADKEKTAWVLVNFLSNAIRFSPERTTIHVVIAQREKTLLFSVQDQGPGIERQYHDRIFERYFRVPAANPQCSAGTGLGLAISRDFINAQNGRIWVESEAGEGSLFCFTLPLAS
ncbi:MAG: HAMP domain-containing protein [Mucilaginibacter polytrichastri]|nr:HAMP domain-containing protein [Mucilaginibacter polytrichastri]